MKFVSKTHDCGAFFFCAGWMAAGHTFKHDNAVIINQALYCQAGGGLINGEPSSSSKVTKFAGAHNVPVTYTSYEAADTIFAAVAHKPGETPFGLEPLPPGTVKNITGNTSECYIACVENNMLANNIKIEEFKFARVNQGQTVAVSVPAGSFGLVLTR